jgi:transcriptional regulator with XRE-family HTH domain
MTQIELEAQAVKQNTHVDLGRSYALHLPRGPRSNADLYHKGSFIKRANLHDKNELRLFAVELMQRGLSQTRLAEVLSLSRQTLHNYRESYREFGVEGLLHGYSPAKSKDEELHRRINVSKRRPGSKAIELQALRRQRKAQASPDAKQDELAWDGSAQTIYELQEPDIEGALRTQRTPSKRAPKTASQAVPDVSTTPNAKPSNPMVLLSTEQTLASEQATPAPSSVPAVIPAEPQAPAPTRAIAVDTEACGYGYPRRTDSASASASANPSTRGCCSADIRRSAVSFHSTPC